MTEEKKAIECLKLKIKRDNSIIQGMFGDIYDEIRKDNKAIETLITVCDKQQKEIELMKTKINKIVLMIKENYNSDFYDDYETIAGLRDDIYNLLMKNNIGE